MRIIVQLMCLYFVANSGHAFTTPRSAIIDNKLMSKDLQQLIASDTVLISSGFNFVEGPVWHPGNYLLFSDIPESRIYKWDEKNNQISTSFIQSNQSNGLSYDKNGKLIVCEHAGRRVTIRDPQTFEIFESISSYQGKSLNSPNDAIVDSRGRLLFTDPPYGIGDAPDLSEGGLGEVFGVYQYDRGKLTLLAK